MRRASNPAHGRDSLLTSSTHPHSHRPHQSNGSNPGIERADDERLHRAILHTVAYSDIFDFPLTGPEIHRYLIGVEIDRDLVSEVLSNGALVPKLLSRRDGYFTLPGRESIVELRRKRERSAATLWPHALFYGRAIARLPFVRMVAVTGELAVNNIRAESDIDYFIVTEPGRLWLTRAMVIAIVKAAALRGITVCPNYLVTENALSIDARNLYSAREMVQMVPLSGHHVYQRLRQTNDWVDEFLPNASMVSVAPHGSAPRGRTRRLSEALLRTRLAERAEQWEMNRKIEKLTRQNGTTDEVAFSADWCKGHFDGHGHQTMQAFTERVRMVEGLMQ